MIRRFSLGMFLLMLLYIIQPFFYSHTANAAGTAMAGTGTAIDPYIITDADQLNSVRNKLGSSYKLGNDIDLSSYSNWEPIGSSSSIYFYGRFDGAGHTITGLTINRTDMDNVGLFGWVGSSGKIENVKLVNVNVTGRSTVGGLVGRNYGGSISYSSVSGNVASSGNYLGGLVGDNYGKIGKSFSSATVKGSTYYYVGGLSGYANNGSSIENSYATGAVTGTGSVGGLLGGNFKGQTINSYATGKVSGTGSTGGLIGSNNSGITTSSFYDKTATQQTDTGKGDPKTTAEMKTKSTFTGADWDFDTVWAMNDGHYPTLQPPVTDDDAVASAKAALEIGYGSGDSETSVTQDLTLPATGASGTTITWSSSDPTVIAANGAVTRPSFTAGDKTVTLTATIKKGTATETKAFTVTVKSLPETDAEAVASAKAALDISFGSGDSETSVTQSLTLPATGASGTTITWSSGDPTVIGEDGKVTRPSSVAGDQAVTLTATITKGTETETKTFTITVKSLPETETDAEAVANAKAALDISFGSGDSETSVTQDLTLPDTGASGTTITWSSGDPTVIGEDGKVTRPSSAAGDQTVTLTATIKKGTETETKTFTVTVKSLPETDAEAVASAKAALDISFGSGDSETSVTQDLTLPDTGASGTTITWSSSDPTVIGEDGKVTRPSSAAGDQTVTLTATIKKGAETETKTFTVTVKTLPEAETETDAEAVANAKAALDISFGSGDSETSVTQDLTLPDTGASGTTITWSSSDPTVIGEDGKVTRPSSAAGDQTVTLTATIKKGDATETKTFTVKVIGMAPPATVTVTGVTLDKPKLSLTARGATVALKATVEPSNATNKNVTWSSSNTRVAKVEGGVVTPLAAGTATITVTTVDGGFTAISKVTVSNPSPVTTTPTPITSPEPSTNEFEVLVNGKAENAGTVSNSTVNDRSVTTVAVNPDKLDVKLAAEGENAVVTILVNNGSDIIDVELNGRMVKNMEQKKAVVEIKTQQATYTLPARQVNIGSISSRLGQSVDLQDIKVHVQIAAPTPDAVKVVEDTASQGGFSLVVPPIEFIVQGTYGGQTVEIGRFDAYVERTIKIPDGVDSNRITTGVVTDPDGTVRHVPTKIKLIDGKYYAVINSLTNSLYSVIWHPVEFSDVESHWARDAVNDMGSRMVVDGTGSGLFSPNRDITRAEFAAILVRGLGLEHDKGSTAFSDVKAADWYAGEVAAAYEYHLITGFEDGTFRPADKITREQAMTMIAKAMQLTGLQDKLSTPSSEISLSAYTDADEIGGWARDGIADSLRAGVSTGRSASEMAPKAFITRAEVATLMQRLLQKSELI